MNSTNQCRWKPSPEQRLYLDTISDDKNYSCAENVWQSKTRLCIFHEAQKNKKLDEFTDAFNDKLMREKKALFVKCHDARGYLFPDNFHFPKIEECGSIDFTVATFGKNVFFSKTHFCRDTTFFAAAFGSNTKFEHTCFSGGPNFQYSKFGQCTKFKRVKFKGHPHPIFDGTQFELGTVFNECTFNSGVSFKQARFGDKSSFDLTIFGPDTKFDGAKFGEEIGFYNLVFHGPVYFNNEANFGDSALFDEIIFENEASFQTAKFGENVVFRMSQFKGAAFFTSAAFKGAVRIEGSDRDGRDFRVFQQSVDFRRAQFLKPEEAVFYKVNLTKARLSEIFNLEKIKFWDVRWADKNGARAIYDELDQYDSHGKKQVFDAAIIERTYRQLWKNYDDSLDYHIAGDFHVGTMRMKEAYLRNQISNSRNLKEKLRFSFFLVVNYIYGAISKYGEGYGRALVWLLSIWLTWTAAYCLLEWVPVSHQESLRYRLFKPLGQSVLDSLRVITFQRLRSNLMEDWRFALVASFQTITMLPILALFLLALKRRFRR